MISDITIVRGPAMEEICLFDVRVHDLDGRVVYDETFAGPLDPQPLELIDAAIMCLGRARAAEKQEGQR